MHNDQYQNHKHNAFHFTTTHLVDEDALFFLLLMEEAFGFMAFASRSTTRLDRVSGLVILRCGKMNLDMCDIDLSPAHQHHAPSLATIQ